MHWVRYFRGLIVVLVTAIVDYSIILGAESIDSQQVVWIAIVILVFGVGMLAMLILEKSVLKNGVYAFLFWIPMAYIHYNGIIVEAKTDVIGGVMDIGFIAMFHAGIQVWLRGFINRSIILKTAVERENKA